jgi:hypothetical protein
VDCVLCVFGVYRLLAVGQELINLLLKFLIVKVHQVGFNFNFNLEVFSLSPFLNLSSAQSNMTKLPFVLNSSTFPAQTVTTLRSTSKQQTRNTATLRTFDYIAPSYPTYLLISLLTYSAPYVYFDYREYTNWWTYSENIRQRQLTY